jgi:hypothetical protein
MVTSVALTSSDGTNVACPATIHVTATVTGTAGQDLHVVLQANFNGQVTAIDGTRSSPDDTILTTGTYTRTFAVPVPVLTAGQDDIVQLIAWQRGDAAPFTTAGNIATFVPTCQPPPTPPPTATPSPSPTPPNGNDLGIPTDLIAVHSAQTCQGLVLASVVGRGCASAVQKGQLVLAWSYTSLSRCGSKCATPNAFVVERSEKEGGAFSPYQLAQYDPKTPAADGIIMSIPYATYGPCYRVSALRGSNDQGPSSKPICIKPDPVTLDAELPNYAHAEEHLKSGALCSPNSNTIGGALQAALVGGKLAAGDFVVGYRDSYTFSQALQCTELYYDRYQTDIVFPLESLPWKNVAHATFTATIVAGAVNAGSDYNTIDNGSEQGTKVNCVATVGVPENFSPGGSMPRTIIHSDFLSVNAGAAATSVSFDITAMVRTWLGPQGHNDGLVLSPQTFRSEGYGSFLDVPVPDNQECMTHFSNAKLLVTY